MEKKGYELPFLQIQLSTGWQDYELLDSGNGRKLERFGPYRLVRPEAEAIWKPALGEREWMDIHAEFKPSPEENGGHWQIQKPIPDRWRMYYRDLNFWVQTSASKHLGVFPEQASQWDWIIENIKSCGKEIKVLNLFGYSGLASLAAVQAGANVTHLDASRKAITWANENAHLNGLREDAIRWMVDDALKFVRREERRQSYYDAILLDPPKFGRGPKGEGWSFYEMISPLLQACRAVLAPDPLFILLTAYAVKASPITLYNALEGIMHSFCGEIEAGEVVLKEKSAGRLLPMAIFARWNKK